MLVFLLALFSVLPLTQGYWRIGFPASMLWVAWAFPMPWTKLLGLPMDFVHFVSCVAYAIFIPTAFVGSRCRSTIALALFVAMLAATVMVSYSV